MPRLRMFLPHSSKVRLFFPPLPDPHPGGFFCFTAISRKCPERFCFGDFPCGNAENSAAYHENCGKNVQRKFRKKYQGKRKKWSEQWDSNPRPSRWQRDALPLSYARLPVDAHYYRRYSVFFKRNLIFFLFFAQKNGMSGKKYVFLPPMPEDFCSQRAAISAAS